MQTVDGRVGRGRGRPHPRAQLGDCLGCQGDFDFSLVWISKETKVKIRNMFYNIFSSNMVKKKKIFPLLSFWDFSNSETTFFHFR